MLTARRTFLAQALVTAGVLSLRPAHAVGVSSVPIENVTRLYTVEVARIATPTTTEDVARQVLTWPGRIAVGGGRYSMGGQVGIRGGLHLDMRNMNKLLSLDTRAKVARVQAGMRWRDLQDVLDPVDLSVKSMQSFSNFTVGGAVSVNAHGRYIDTGPVGSTVRALKIVMADGAIMDASPTVNPELFRAAIGGYGAVGVITEVELDLADNTRMERVVKPVALEDYPAHFASVKREFVYGGEAHFDNMRGFFTGNGFQKVVDRSDMQPRFEGSWGASDEDLFDKSLERLKLLHARKKPFFSLIFSSSNHAPFEFPDGKIELHDATKQTVNNAVKYADFALGKFIAEAKKQDYWKDTVFLIVADHDNRVYGNNLVPIKKFHIAGLILGADLQPKRISTIASQIDLGPTLLSLMGVSSVHPMIGRDLVKDSESPGRALLQFENYFTWLEGTSATILRPNQAPLLAQYDASSGDLALSAEKPSGLQVDRAMAHVILPSLMYREQRYKLPK